MKALLLLLTVSLAHVVQVIGFLEFNLQYGEPLVKGDTDFVNFDKMRVKKVNRTHHLVVGEVVFHVPVGNEVRIETKLFKKAGNDYKLLPFKTPEQGYCEFVQSDTVVWPQLEKVSDFPEQSVCPWPRGAYHVNGFTFDISSLKTAAMILKSGDYKAGHEMSIDGKVLQAEWMYFSIINLVN